MKKKLFPVIILFMILPALLSATGSREKQPGTQPGAAIQPAEAEKIDKITAFLDTTMLQIDEGQQEFRNEFKRLTGIQLDIIQPPHQQYMEKLLLQLASGDLPDVCEVFSANLAQIVSDGVALPLDSHIHNAEYLNSMYPRFIEAVRFKDGHVYGIQTRNGGGCVTYIRKDWLDKMGLAMPQTWEDFMNVCRAFTTGDPDGNGKNDTFGYTEPLGAPGSEWDWYNRLVMLDARSDLYKKNGVWVDGFQEPAMKKALQRYIDLYKSGTLDKEFFTNKTSTARSKFTNGQAGIFTYWANQWARNLLVNARAAVGDQAEVVPMPPLAGQTYIRRVAPVLVITVGCKNPEQVFYWFFDKQYDKAEIQTLFTYGVEGYHWAKNSAGIPEFLPNPKAATRAPFTKAYVPPMDILNDWKQPMPIDPVVVPALEIFNKYAVQDPVRSGGENYSKYYTELTDTLKPEIFAKIVIGEYTIEQGLARYAEQARKLHLDNILAELNK